jgi:lysylphosphatidylglycerol synthetase-like protein (DUF2156 family)
MKKTEVVWLSIRLIGLGFALYSIYLISIFIENILLIMFTTTYSLSENIRVPNLRWDPLLEAFLLGGVALYFLVGGRTVYKLLIRECSGSELP